jgi:hypothetical protein
MLFMLLIQLYFDYYDNVDAVGIVILSFDYCDNADVVDITTLVCFLD